MVDAAVQLELRKPKTARLWWLVHQWAGLKLAILLSFILFTGTLAVLSYEMDWLLRPALRVDPSTVSGGVNWTATAANVAAHAPQSEIVLMAAPLDPWFAAATIVRDADGTLRFVYTHPTTGAVQGDGGWVGAQRILRNMHRHLNLPTAIGVPLVTFLAIPLLVSLVTSFIVYKKWWRGFFRWPRRGDGRMVWGDVHRLAGLWSLWFVALMIATGLWYLVESLGGAAPAMPRANAEPVTASAADHAASLPQSLEAARAAFPELDIVRIVFPVPKNGVFQFQGQHEAILVRERANTVWTDAASGAVLRVTDGRDLNVHQRISEMADPLHFGTFGGLATKLIWFVFGLAMTAVAVSGVAIYATRLAKAERRPQAWRPGMADAWRGMGLWRWPALAGVLVAFLLLPELLFGSGTD